MNADEPQTDREWLMRIDGKVDQLLTCQQDHEIRIRNLQDQQLKWLGRDGAIVAGISGMITCAGLFVSYWRH
jgi:hypothetical protein